MILQTHAIIVMKPVNLAQGTDLIIVNPVTKIEHILVITFVFVTRQKIKQ